MSDLVSKISASGLSAGVFLVWWPAHVASQGGDVLLARGVLWAAAFELLLLGFRPLERAVGRAVREREAAALAPRRIGTVLAVAFVAAAVPAVLLAGARGTVTPARAAAPKVIVKREIVRREVVVRRVSHVVRVPVPVAATGTARPDATTVAPFAKPVVRRAATAAPTRAATTTPARTKTASSTAADTKRDLPASTTTTPTAPAATSSSAQPSTPAATTPASPSVASSPR